MNPPRLFVPQYVLDEWVVQGAAEVEGETLSTQHPRVTYGMKAALRFLRELTSSGDVEQWVGTVKTTEAVKSRGGEHYRDSVVLGETAYEVEEGFLCVPQPEASSQRSEPSSHRNFASSPSDLDMLAQLFLGERP
jgi:hypothetical protein